MHGFVNPGRCVGDTRSFSNAGTFSNAGMQDLGVNYLCTYWGLEFDESREIFVCLVY